jgi:hypothetical protein
VISARFPPGQPLHAWRGATAKHGSPEPVDQGVTLRANEPWSRPRRSSCSARTARSAVAGVAAATVSRVWRSCKRDGRARLRIRLDTNTVALTIHGTGQCHRAGSGNLDDGRQGIEGRGPSGAQVAEIGQGGTRLSDRRVVSSVRSRQSSWARAGRAGRGSCLLTGRATLNRGRPLSGRTSPRRSYRPARGGTARRWCDGEG